MGRRLGIALAAAILLVALALPPTVHADDDSSSPIGFLKSSFKSVRRSAQRSLKQLQQTTARVANQVVKFTLVRSTEDEICYHILGCFSLKAPWISVTRPVPAPREPARINVRYYLYSREFPERYNITSDPTMSLDGIPFDADRRTFFIVHGYLNDGNATWMADLKDAILGQVDGNVFIVDWGDGAQEVNYLQAASNTRVVGREIAWLARLLIEKHGASAKDMHLLGHSLGSHISGYAARNITNVGRVTALDPAGPGFEALPRLVRISKYVADFVDVLHTNAKPVTALGFGMMNPVGHVDFYLNGGVDQPGCATPTVEAPKSLVDLVTFPITAVNDLVSCSHVRSHEYITEAIKNPECRMWGHKVNVVRQRLWWKRHIPSEVPVKSGPCKTGACVPIGLDAPEYPARGAFSVATDSASPYCKAANSHDGQTIDELEDLENGLYD